MSASLETSFVVSGEVSLTLPSTAHVGQPINYLTIPPGPILNQEERHFSEVNFAHFQIIMFKIRQSSFRKTPVYLNDHIKEVVSWPQINLFQEKIKSTQNNATKKSQVSSNPGIEMLSSQYSTAPENS